MDNGSGATPVAPPFTPEPARLRPIVALTRGWWTFRANLGLSLGALLVVWVICLVGEIVPFLNFAFAALVMPALGAGTAHFLARMARGESPAFESVFDGFKRWPTATGAILLYAVGTLAIMTPAMVVMVASLWTHGMAHQDPSSIFPAVFGPFLALAIPGEVVICWLASRFWPVAFVVMEPECTGAIDALRRSWNMTRGNAWRSFGLMMLVIPIEIVGVLALVVGIVPALITWYIAIAHGYEMLRPRPAEAAATGEVLEPAPAGS